LEITAISIMPFGIVWEMGILFAGEED
jgi:hypothetical protein